MAEHVCAEVPHRQFVFTIPKRLRFYFRFDRQLLGDPAGAGRAAAGTGIPARAPRKGWAALIKRVYEVNPLRCARCGAELKIIALIERHQNDVIENSPVPQCGMDCGERLPPGPHRGGR